MVAGLDGGPRRLVERLDLHGQRRRLPRSWTWAPTSSPLKKDDRVVFTQNPDATFSAAPSCCACASTPGRAVKPGEVLTITVLGDDVAKANSAAEATRYGLDPVADPEVVEDRPSSPLSSAPRSMSAAGCTSTAPPATSSTASRAGDLPKGTYGVWAEMAMDAATPTCVSGLSVQRRLRPAPHNVVGSATLTAAVSSHAPASRSTSAVTSWSRVFNSRGQVSPA